VLRVIAVGSNEVSDALGGAYSSGGQHLCRADLGRRAARLIRRRLRGRLARKIWTQFPFPLVLPPARKERLHSGAADLRTPSSRSV
jgi:hypothetical protein